MTNKSQKHFDQKVPNLELKLRRFFSIGSQINAPQDRASLVKHINGLKISGASGKSMENLLPPNPSANGNETQHQVIVETYLGEGSWPFPEYYDTTGRQRDEDLGAFHAGLDEWFKVIRFEAQGTENTNRNMEYDPRYVSAGLDYKKDRNELRLNATCGTLNVEGPVDSLFPLQLIATIRVKEVTVEIFSEGGSTRFLKAMSVSAESHFESLDTDKGFRFYMKTPEEVPTSELYRASTPWITYKSPDDESELRVEVRSGIPDFDIPIETIPEGAERLEAYKIARAHMDNKLKRAKSVMDLGRIEEDFVVYRMGYSHYEEQ